MFDIEKYLEIVLPKWQSASIRYGVRKGTILRCELILEHKENKKYHLLKFIGTAPLDGRDPMADSVLNAINKARNELVVGDA